MKLRAECVRWLHSRDGVGPPRQEKTALRA